MLSIIISSVIIILIFKAYIPTRPLKSHESTDCLFLFQTMGEIQSWRPMSEQFFSKVKYTFLKSKPGSDTAPVSSQ